MHLGTLKRFGFVFTTSGVKDILSGQDFWNTQICSKCPTTLVVKQSEQIKRSKNLKWPVPTIHAVVEYEQWKG